MSNRITCDMLGSDGSALMKKVIKAHKKSLWRDEQKLQRILDAVQFFQRRMDKRREILLKKREASAGKEINQVEYTWRNDYRKILKERENAKVT